MSGALDQPLLGYGIASGMLNDLQDGGGLGQPIAEATDNTKSDSDRVSRSTL